MTIPKLTPRSLKLINTLMEQSRLVGYYHDQLTDEADAQLKKELKEAYAELEAHLSMIESERSSFKEKIEKLKKQLAYERKFKDFLETQIPKESIKKKSLLDSLDTED